LDELFELEFEELLELELEELFELELEELFELEFDELFELEFDELLSLELDEEFEELLLLVPFQSSSSSSNVASRIAGAAVSRMPACMALAIAASVSSCGSIW
jgi:hypothetical protein